MGLAGELMRSVFSKGRPDMNGRCGFRFGGRRKCGGVRLSLCGDEFGLIPAEEDSASLQHLPGESSKKEEMRLVEENIPREKANSVSKLFREQDAAVVIQTAFRSYMARKQRKEEMVHEVDDKLLLHPIGRDWSPNVESINTSLEVHSAYSVQVLSETPAMESPAREPSGGESAEAPSEDSVHGQSIKQDRSTEYPQRRKPRISVLRAKEKWDDSTVSNNVAEMRIKRRLEAMTRRERALAYAFSQQLRVCSRKRTEGKEANAGCSWLERWMATRPSENFSPLDGNIGPIPGKQQCGKTRGNLLDLAGEEKESCGSNEVPLNKGSFAIGSHEEKKSMQSKHSLKPSRTKLMRNAKPGAARKFRKLRMLPDKKVSEDGRHEQMSRSKGIDLEA